MIRPVAAYLLLLCLGLAPCAGAQVIEVPLQYDTGRDLNLNGFKIASAKIADFDMTAPGAREPQLSIDFAAPERSKGFLVPKDEYTSKGQVAGRACTWIPGATGMQLLCTSESLSKLSGRRLYLEIEYFDDVASHVLYLTHLSSESRKPFQRCSLYGPVLEGTKTWRKCQLPINGWLGDKRRDPSLGSVGESYWLNLALVKLPTGLPWGSSTLEVSDKLPEGQWKLPKLNAKMPVYAMLELGDKPQLMVFDSTTAQHQALNRIYFDSNANGDLTDDPVTDQKFLTGREPNLYIGFPRMEASVTVAGKTQPYSFSISYRGAKQPDKDFGQAMLDRNIRPLLESSSRLFGEFKLNGNNYWVVLHDPNVNGRFCDTLSIRGTQNDSDFTGDRLLLLKQNPFGDAEDFVLGNLLWLEGKLYTVHVNDAERKLTLSPTGEKLERLKLSSKPSTLQLFDEHAKHSVMACDPPEELMLPKGRYYLASYKLSREAKDDQLWELTGEAKTLGCWADTCQPGTATPSTTTTLVFGEPFTARPSAEPYPDYLLRRQGLTQADACTSLMLQLALRGAGNETISNISLKKGNPSDTEMASSTETDKDKPREPRYRIATADGEIVAEGSFEYG